LPFYDVAAAGERSARMARHTAHDNPRLLSDERCASGPPGL